MLLVTLPVTLITLVSMLFSPTIWQDRMTNQKLIYQPTKRFSWLGTDTRPYGKNSHSFFMSFISTKASVKHGWTDDKLSKMIIEICLLVFPEVQVFPLRQCQRDGRETNATQLKSMNVTQLNTIHVCNTEQKQQRGTEGWRAHKKPKLMTECIRKRNHGDTGG